MFDLENSVRNDVLCYVSTSRNSLSSESIVKNTIAFYKDESIREAKELVFKICGERPITRKACSSHPNPSVADVGDILNLFEKMDQKRKLLPDFLAGGFNSLPPAGFEVLASVLCSLRDEISALRLEVTELRNKNETDVKDLEDLGSLRADVSDIKIMISGSDRGQTANGEISESSNSNVDTNLPFYSQVVQGGKKPLLSKNPPTALSPKRSALLRNASSTSGSQATSNAVHSNPPNPSSQSIMGARNRGPSTQPSHRRTQKVNIQGTKEGVQGGLVGVDPVVDIFVGGCSLEATPENIEELCQQHNVNVCKCEPLPTKSQWYKSFKVSTLLHDREKLLSADVWPRGVFVRKFYRPRRPGGNNA